MIPLMVATGMGKRAETVGADIAFELHCPDFEVPADVGAYTKDKLLAKLAKFSSQITEVIVHLREGDTTRSGLSRACHIEVRLARHEPVNVAECDDDLRASIDLAIKRTSETVHRHLERTRSKRLNQGRKLARRAKTAL